MEVLQKVKEVAPQFDGAIIILTAYGDINSAIKAMKLGAYDYITKPFDNDGLLFTIDKALNNQRLAKEVKMLRKQLGDRIGTEKVMGKSDKIKDVVKRVSLIAPTNMSVIIQGASGTGKEVISKLIHQKSLRKDKPFIPIDCGAIPENLVESELFGYEKGAFTGANKDKKGKFELAEKGTLFLDEITNLPESAQAKFLRALEAREIVHIGGKKPIKVDVRIITASNINLVDAVSQGDFREDLYHRLNEFKIMLPLLKERTIDIPILAQIFLEDSNKELNKNISGFTNSSIKKMLEYSWPGNIRELRNVIKKAVLLEDKEKINHENLEFEGTVKNKKSSKDSVEEYTHKILELGFSLKDIMFELNNNIEKEIIISILKEVHYNKSKAAKILDIERKTLYSKISLFGIES